MLRPQDTSSRERTSLDGLDATVAGRAEGSHDAPPASAERSAWSAS
jgi:hypothetical protein